MPPSISEKLKSIAFVDTETTGLNVVIDRVIEVGILVVENGEITKTFSKVVNPGIKIPEESYKITGIKKKEIK